MATKITRYARRKLHKSAHDYHPKLSVNERCSAGKRLIKVDSYGSTEAAHVVFLSAGSIYFKYQFCDEKSSYMTYITLKTFVYLRRMT